MDCVFEKVKDVITSSPALAYFNDQKDVLIQADASKKWTWSHSI